MMIKPKTTKQGVRDLGGTHKPHEVTCSHTYGVNKRYIRTHDTGGIIEYICKKCGALV